MTNVFKVGDKVRFNTSPRATSIQGWRTAAGLTAIPAEAEFNVIATSDRACFKLPPVISLTGPGLMQPFETWEEDAFEKAEPAVTQTAVATLLADHAAAPPAKLYPQDRTILTHLQKGKPITPMKALTIFGYTRLAAQIRNIRKAGYKVEMVMRQDEVGHKYAEYRLAA